MKNTFKAFKIIGAVAISAITLVACDKDFTSIESDIQGSENFLTDSQTYPILAHNKKVNPVQTNNLTSNLLGVYNDDVYGLSTASIITQVALLEYNPDFGSNPEIESITLSIPYFVTNEGKEEDETIYSIDSLFGSEPIKLSVYQNNYFIREFDPESNFEETQNYYSNSNTGIPPHSNQDINFDDHINLAEPLYLNETFRHNPDEIPVYEINEETGENEIVERLSPRINIELDNPNNFWENLLFDHQDTPELSNANNFKEFFRGLYIKAEAKNGNGNMVMLNLNTAAAKITVNYSNDGEEEDSREDHEFFLSFSGTQINAIQNELTPSIINEIENPDITNGDSSLYLKGGEGAMAVINLFNGFDIDSNNNEDNMFEAFKKQFVETDDSNNQSFIKAKQLVNEANIVFYVDQNAGLTNSQQPDRVTLYDIDNNQPIMDYFIDLSTNTNDPLNSKTVFSEKLEREEDGTGIKYKIRVTEHINNLILKDSTNVKLGLFVTTNINEFGNSAVFESNNDILSICPGSTVLSPKGTVLHGSNAAVPEDKRVQLEIYYTEQIN